MKSKHTDIMLRIGLLWVLGLTGLPGCIENDLPYPELVPGISSVVAEGMSGYTVDADACSVNIDLQETVDIASVNITSVTVSEGAEVSPAIVGRHDMRSAFKVKLITFDEYEWTFSATQDIERYFTVESQVGQSEIDAVNRRAIATVRAAKDVSDISVTSLKLGPAGLTDYSKALSEMRDFTHGVTVLVSAHGRSEEWTLYVEQTETLVELTSVNPWTRVAWVTAAGLSDQKNGFRYRVAGTSVWNECSDVTSEGGSFSAVIDGLEPMTTYECVAYSGENETDVQTFTTEREEQLPNSGFEIFSHDESQNYFSLYDPLSVLSFKWWDSGNIGSTTVGAAYSICTPDTEDFREGRASIRMNSRNVIIKFAAGNMFSGEFAGLIGTQGGKVNFGRPFSLRPRALKLWLKYECGAVDCVGTYPDGHPVKTGDPDTGTVYVALGDWDYRKYGGSPQSPVQVNTTDRSSFFKSDSEAVIAYGCWESSSSTGGWKEVEIPLSYRSLSRVPGHIIVSCASSALGDYFTGSSKSVLWVDDMRLIY